MSEEMTACPRMVWPKHWAPAQVPCAQEPKHQLRDELLCDDHYAEQLRADAIAEAKLKGETWIVGAYEWTTNREGHWYRSPYGSFGKTFDNEIEAREYHEGLRQRPFTRAWIRKLEEGMKIDIFGDTDEGYDTQRFYEGVTEPHDGRLVVRHYEEGSVIYPSGSEASIFKVVNGTPCMDRDLADSLVRAYNASVQPSN